MDEIEDPRLHQWLSGCRKLMSVTPQHGVDELDLDSGFGQMRFRPGWNRLGQNFIYIPEEPTERALNTLNEPPPGTPIHRVPPGPSMLSSHFWHTIMPSFAAKFGSDAAVEWPAELVAKVTRQIESAHQTFGAGGPSDALMALAVSARETMIEARNFSIAGDPQVDQYLAPTRNVVRAYMAFELPGRIAADLLALLLTIQVDLPKLGPPSTAPPAARATAAEYLIALATRLVERRAALQVAPYFELSYLANLYFMTATILVSHAEECEGLSSEQIKALKGRSFVAEERRAHRVAPVFGTGLFANAGKSLVDMAESTGQSLSKLCRSYAVHPALRQTLLGYETPAQIDPEAILRDYRQAATSFEEHDVAGRLEGEYSPIAPENQARIVKAMEDLGWDT